MIDIVEPARPEKTGRVYFALQRTQTTAIMRLSETTQQLIKWLTYTRPRNRNAGPCSYNMSRVRSKDTKPELIVRKFLHVHGLERRFDPVINS